jgi:hypothetical protein
MDTLKVIAEDLAAVRSRKDMSPETRVLIVEQSLDRLSFIMWMVTDNTAEHAIAWGLDALARDLHAKYYARQEG